MGNADDGPRPGGRRSAAEGKAASTSRNGKRTRHAAESRKDDGLETVMKKQAKASAEKTDAFGDLFLRTLVEAIPNPVFYKDREGLYRFCNDAFLDYLGLPREKIIGKGVYDVSPGPLADVYHEADLKLMASRGKQVYDARIRYADGTLHDAVFNKATVVGDDGKILGIVGIILDVTEKTEIERQLFLFHSVKDKLIELSHSILEFEDLSRFFQETLVTMLDIFPECSRATASEVGNDERVSLICTAESACMEFGIPRLETIGNGAGIEVRIVEERLTSGSEDPSSVFERKASPAAGTRKAELVPAGDPATCSNHGDKPRRLAWNLRETAFWSQDACEGGICIHDLTKPVSESPETLPFDDFGEHPRCPRAESAMSIPVTMNGAVRWVLTLESPKAGRFGATERKVSEYIQEELPILIRMLNLHLENTLFARFDTMTGLTNRGYFDAILDDRIEAARRADTPLLLAMLDLDGLKRVNDAYGHPAGDAYITALSHLLRTSVRRSDAVGRIGGDEFAVVFANAHRAEIERLMADMQHRFSAHPVVYGNGTFVGGFSFGIASFPEEAEEKEALFRLADRRMYADKAERKRREPAR